MRRTLPLHTVGTIVAAAVIAGSVSCIAPAAAQTAAGPTTVAESARPSDTIGDSTDRVARRVRRIMSQMTLRQKVGQLFVVQFAGQSARRPDQQSAATNKQQYGVASPAEIVRRYGVGGVIYFGANVDQPLQVARMSDGLQRAARTSDPSIPLLISTDQEGGSVTRFSAPATVSPGNMAVGATFDPVQARRVAAVLADELRLMGVRQNLAPVVDVNIQPVNPTDGTRSFGDRPGPVSRFSLQSVRGLQRQQVAATIKHFPGLGDTTTDTDAAPATSDQTRGQFRRVNFPPFEAGIAAGTDTVMVSHLVAPALDPSGSPASLSRPMVTGILRQKMGFSGVAMTDALSAGALAQWSNGTIVRRAMRAGNDLLLMPRQLGSGIRSLVRAARADTRMRQRVDSAVSRILTRKIELGLFADPWSAGPKQVRSQVGSAAHRRITQRAADLAATLVDRTQPGAPLQSGDRVLLVGAGYGTAVPAIGSKLQARGAVVDIMPTGADPDAAQIAAAVAAVPGHDLVLLTTYDALRNPGQQQLISAIRATGAPYVLGQLSTPYDAVLAPDARAIVAVYTDMPPALTALVKTLFGREPTGRLPVTVRRPGSNDIVYPYGRGLSWG